MRVRGLGFVVLFSMVTAIGTNAFAAFEPLFRVIRVTGECMLQRPGESEAIAAEESKAYPYGTNVRTGMRSSLVIVLSEGNICRVLANADVVMAEGVTDKKLKIIRLNEGEVEVELEEGFSADGTALNVETATAICGAIGCKFRVASKQEADLRIIILRVIQGTIRVHGENFDATTLDQDDWLSLLSPPDRSFLRLKTMKGKFPITIKDEDLQDKEVPTEEGTVLKLWQRKVPGTDQHVVVAELTGPDGQLIESVTVTYGEGETSGFGGNNHGETPPWGSWGGPAGEGLLPLAAGGDGGVGQPGPVGGPGSAGGRPRPRPRMDAWDSDNSEKDPDPGQDDVNPTPHGRL